MGLKDVDIEGALRRLADRKIEEALRAGKFDNLPGKGKPLDLEPMPAEENARMRWWALRILKQNDVIPEEVQWRKQVDALKDELATTLSDVRLIALVNAINALVRKLNTLGTNALPARLSPLSVEDERQRLIERRSAYSTQPAPSGASPAQRRCGGGGVSV